ncbi:hypothetical protein EDB85DRAFT_1573138 [Lactarius pseudohatsudake]|nr:hypothetical protein EDB85DRAFT_1573138 [Lactarius pseudohatsudake]
MRPRAYAVCNKGTQNDADSGDCLYFDLLFMKPFLANLNLRAARARIFRRFHVSVTSTRIMNPRMGDIEPAIYIPRQHSLIVVRRCDINRGIPTIESLSEIRGGSRLVLPRSIPAASVQSVSSGPIHCHVTGSFRSKAGLLCVAGRAPISQGMEVYLSTVSVFRSVIPVVVDASGLLRSGRSGPILYVFSSSTIRYSRSTCYPRHFHPTALV